MVLKWLQETAQGNLAIFANGLGLVYNQKSICALQEMLCEFSYYRNIINRSLLFHRSLRSCGNKNDIRGSNHIVPGSALHYHLPTITQLMNSFTPFSDRLYSEMHSHLRNTQSHGDACFLLIKHKVPWCMVDERLWFILRKVVVSKFITGRNAWPCFLTWSSCI